MWLLPLTVVFIFLVYIIYHGPIVGSVMTIVTFAVVWTIWVVAEQNYKISFYEGKVYNACMANPEAKVLLYEQKLLGFSKQDAILNVEDELVAPISTKALRDIQTEVFANDDEWPSLPLMITEQRILSTKNIKTRHTLRRIAYQQMVKNCSKTYNTRA